MSPKVKRFSAAIILAGGTGTRFGGDKCVSMLNGYPTIYYSFKTIYDTKLMDIILVIHRDEIQKNFINKFLEKTDSVFFEKGGNDRKSSVWNGILFLKKNFPEIKNLFIHDGARPLVTEKNIIELNEKIKNHQAAVLCHRIVDTVVSMEENQIKYLDRNMLYAIETPQAFNFPLIYDGYKNAMDQNLPLGDDSSAIDDKAQIQFIENATCNIKITFPRDLSIVNALLPKAH
ncbi:MAG: 2-C-methyl-D-erythritol 4-phosphate cytidylyltransferase [Puniceicoccales bacterium]|jgi:2-C-methyl-D-erythritol 4-phosphate cytidylyltransferase|nr:2-C-methyl-D-erythritol 4-phosphate cytidylyltransferase [Puniceicoccales bacterium]